MKKHNFGTRRSIVVTKKFEYHKWKRKKRKKIGGAIESLGVDVVKFSPIFSLNFNFGFNVREYFGNYKDLVFAVVYNSQHYLKEHMFKPREILEEEALVECRPVKSVFLETLSEDNIIQYVKEALLYTNICVENERSFVVKICTK